MCLRWWWQVSGIHCRFSSIVQLKHVRLRQAYKITIYILSAKKTLIQIDDGIRVRHHPSHQIIVHAD